MSEQTSNGAGDGGTPESANPASDGGTPTLSNFDSWIGQQPETVRTLFDEHMRPLRTALESYKEQRRQSNEQSKQLKKELEDLKAKAEKGSELEGQLQKLLAEKDAAERRATFLEAAQATNCTNPKAAFLIAQTEGLFKRDGTPDWEAIQTFAPEFFRPKTQAVNAGAGTQGAPPTGKNMNDFLRRAAGRG